jgi:hypothetical protein
MPNIRVLVKDTANVYYHLADGTTRFFGCMATAGLEKTIDTEEIRCGIGWGISAIMYTNPSMELTLTPAFWNDFFIESASGTAFELDQSVDVWTHEDVTFVLSTADATAEITGTPVDDEVEVQDAQGTMWPATFAGSTVTVTGGAVLAGTKGVVSYKKAVTGDVLTFKDTDIPQVHGITLETIAYDPDTNIILSTLYFTFDKVVGDGGLSLALAGATNSVAEIKVTVLTGQNNVMGRYIVVDET